MRTKTLILSAALGALSSASLMAQVYSLNAVGYINVTLNPGYTQIANQLNTTNNFISPLLDAQLGTNPSFAGCKMYKYTPTGYLQWNITLASQANYQNSIGIPEVAASGISAATVTLNPGEGLFFFNKWSTNINLQFVGTVLTGNVTNTPPNAMTNVMNLGIQMVSSMVPVAGAVDSVLGIAPVKADKVFYWDHNLGGGVGAYASYTYTPSGGWSIQQADSSGNTHPTVAVGQSFWYVVGANDAGGKNTWVENFNVNQ